MLYVRFVLHLPQQSERVIYLSLSVIPLRCLNRRGVQLLKFGRNLLEKQRPHGK